MVCVLGFMYVGLCDSFLWVIYDDDVCVFREDYDLFETCGCGCFIDRGLSTMVYRRLCLIYILFLFLFSISCRIV